MRQAGARSSERRRAVHHDIRDRLPLPNRRFGSTCNADEQFTRLSLANKPSGDPLVRAKPIWYRAVPGINPQGLRRGDSSVRREFRLTHTTLSEVGLQDFDLIVVGGGVLGLSTAFSCLSRFPSQRVCVLEKESDVALHQTGRNSGVIHSGIYYKPGSLKAVNCRRGKSMLEAFCRSHGVAHEICGKVIVAVDESEVAGLHRIADRGIANGVRCELISPERLRVLEPHVTGVAAVHVPETGIVDYAGMCRTLVRLIEDLGSRVCTKQAVEGIARRSGLWIVRTPSTELTSPWLVNCAGLHSDRVTTLTGGRSPVQIVPFRGEYYELAQASHALCRNLIYPVPDPNFPFLGVHFTRMIHGGVECGPNAVLALAREGYDWSQISPHDALELLTSPAVWKVVKRHWRTGLGEMHRSISKSAFTLALQRLIPELRDDDLSPAPSGVRAQAVSPDGQLLDDFAIEQREGVVNVCNAPSPAATAALSIAESIVDLLAQQGLGSTRGV